MPTNIDTALTTLAATKIFLNVGQDAANTSRDSQISALISAVSGEISTFCGRKFAQATYTNEIYNGNGSEFLWLRNWPTTVTSIYEDSGGAFGSGTLLTARSGGSGDYWAMAGEESHGRVVKVNGVWGAGHGNIQVTYVGGYATIPTPISELAHEWIGILWARSERKAHDMQSQAGPAGGSTSYLAREIPADITARLMRWKAIRIYG